MKIKNLWKKTKIRKQGEKKKREDNKEKKEKILIEFPANLKEKYPTVFSGHQNNVMQVWDEGGGCDSHVFYTKGSSFNTRRKSDNKSLNADAQAPTTCLAPRN